MVSLNPVRILKNEADEEKAEVKRKKNWCKIFIFFLKKVVISSDPRLLATMGKTDSQQYPWNLYLIINLEDIAVF